MMEAKKNDRRKLTKEEIEALRQDLKDTIARLKKLRNRGKEPAVG